MIDRESFCVLAIENIKNICYINNHDTKDMLFMNSEAMRVFNIKDEEQYKNKKCYEIIFGNNENCENCVASPLHKEQFLTSMLYIPKIEKHLYFTNSLKIENEVKLHIVSAFDVSDFQAHMKNLELELKTESSLLKGFETFSENISLQDAINSLLEIVARYYMADRASLFEINTSELNFSKKYEYNALGVKPAIYDFINIPLSEIRDNIQSFKEGKSLFLSTKSEEDSKNIEQSSFENRYFFEKNVFKLLDVVLVLNNEIIGFITIENPKIYTNRIDILKGYSHLFLQHLQHFKMKAQMEYVEYIDPLTRVLNRKKFQQILQTYSNKKPASIGIINISINEMKAYNELYGYVEGDKIIEKCGQVLKKYFDAYVYRTSGDEFICMVPEIKEEVFNALYDKLKDAISDEKNLKLSLGVHWKEGDFNLINEIQISDSLMNKDKQNYYKSIAPVI